MNEQDKRFMELMQSFDRLYEEYAKAKGLTYISLTVLDAIYECEDNCTQKQICEQTHYPKQSVNLVIKSFWENGYVELCEMPTDRRNKQIVLTEKGRAYADEIVGALWQADEEATETLSEAQRQELLKLLGIYEQAFAAGVNALMQRTNKSGTGMI